MTFTELSAFMGQDLREVYFDIAKGDVEIFRQMEGFKDYNPETEALNLKKPIYGLKDAPRAWRSNRHRVLIELLSCRQLYAEPELHVVHVYRDDTNNWST